MAKATVRRIKSDYIKATKDGVNALVIAISKQGQANSIRIVRKDTARLAGSIDILPLKRFKSGWFTDVIYALAQEYGIPGTKYTFRSFMRRSAIIMRGKLGRMSKAIMRKAYANMRTRRE